MGQGREGQRPANQGSITVFLIAWILGLILSGIDLAATLYLHHRGLLQEMNPIADYFFGWGPESVICLKMFCIAVFSSAVWVLYLKNYMAALGTLFVILGILILVMIQHGRVFYAIYTV